MCYWENPILCGWPLRGQKTPHLSGQVHAAQTALSSVRLPFSTLCFHSGEADGKLVAKSENREQGG